MQSVAAVLADTSDGLTGGEIGELLSRLDMQDPLRGATKRVRLAEAFVVAQSRFANPRRIITFIVTAMEPVRYRNDLELSTLREDRLNEHLAFVGLRVNDKGEVAREAKAQTLDEATRIATSIHNELQRRKVHPEVLRYCSVEVLKKVHFRACLEATKIIFERLRRAVGLQGDGAALVDAALALGKTGVPALAINELGTQTERDEQTGLANLIKGLGGLYRSPTAHDWRLNRSVSDDELLEALTMVSMVHRRLDGARIADGSSS
nr:TIGR02391 family protein [Helcobacillus massiliensis]